MVLSNDERGWVMTSLSGVACVVGASVICVDIIVRQFPGKKDFKIQDSDAFLSTSLSLSFGVMLFSSLYSMLPSAKSSLIKSGYDPKTATWIMIACFLGGFVGIQFISRILHKFIPSHVVDCEHTHGDDEERPKETQHSHSHGTARPKRPRSSTKSSLPGHLHRPDPPLPKRRKNSYFSGDPAAGSFAPTAEIEAQHDGHAEARPATAPPRPSFAKRITSRLSKLTAADKDLCDTDGPCKGFSDLCGTECFKNVNTWNGTKAAPRSNGRASLRQTKSVHLPVGESTPLLHDIEELHHTRNHEDDHDHVTTSHGADENHDHHDGHEHAEHGESHHHHHVPTNAFLSIGLQTSIAIALHKLPEGFITYATNHANPQLGFAVFLALFIHNITEGFAMALPLYLAINSRVKAMFWSFVLGGLSQPLGAGIAALWFKVAGNGNWAPSEGVYGGMFAATAGIMVSVALQLFSESLDLSHSRTLCMVGAITEQGRLDAETRQSWLQRLEIDDKARGRLLSALAKAQVASVKEILGSGIFSKKDIRSGDLKLPTGLTALHLAALFGDGDVLEELLQLNADTSVTIYAEIASYSVATKYWMDARPLLFAVGAKNKTTIDLLLQHGAPVQMSDAWPLYSSEWWQLTGRFGWSDTKAILEMLLQHGLDVNERVAKQRWSMLHYCVNLEPRDRSNAEQFFQERYETVNYLLQYGADALLKDSLGRTAYALIEERVERRKVSSTSSPQSERLRHDADRQLQDVLQRAMASRLEHLRAQTGLRGSLQRLAVTSQALDRIPLLRSRASSLRRSSMSSFGGQSQVTDVALVG